MNILLIGGIFGENAATGGTSDFARDIACDVLDPRSYPIPASFSLVNGGTARLLEDIASGEEICAYGYPDVILWMPDISGCPESLRKRLGSLPMDVKRTWPDAALVCAFDASPDDPDPGRDETHCGMLEYLADKLGADFALEIYTYADGIKAYTLYDEDKRKIFSTSAVATAAQVQRLDAEGLSIAARKSLMSKIISVAHSKAIELRMANAEREGFREKIRLQAMSPEDRGKAVKRKYGNKGGDAE